MESQIWQCDYICTVWIIFTALNVIYFHSRSGIVMVVSAALAIAAVGSSRGSSWLGWALYILLHLVLTKELLLKLRLGNVRVAADY